MTISDVDLKSFAEVKRGSVGSCLWGMGPAEIAGLARRQDGPRVMGDGGACSSSCSETLHTEAWFDEKVELDDFGRLRRVRRHYAAHSASACDPTTTEGAGVVVSGPGRRSGGGDAGADEFARACCGEDEDCAELFSARGLAQLCDSPALPQGVRAMSDGVWAHESARIAPGARFVAPVWIGQDARVLADETIVGPCVIPDGRIAPARCAQVLHDSVRVFLPELGHGISRKRSKRVFDVVASLVVLAATLPISLVIMLAIWVQAGRPIFFHNERQTLGGRRFQCWKFRTMRQDAESVKGTFADRNTCDGPQFHIPNDPRTFAVGRVIRRCHLDELPQLMNVLLGDMSIVGPRPSPDGENQCCPTWREARLGLRAGITGLWQVRCNRRPGTDFQEWIRYDLEYIRDWSWSLDLGIMLRTATVAIKGGAGLVSFDLWVRRRRAEPESGRHAARGAIIEAKRDAVGAEAVLGR